jgi:MFS transporter, AAHS family, 3-hydroxyphenylpropionic acid transporter
VISSPRHSTATLWLCAAAAVFEGFDNQSVGVAMPRLALEFALDARVKGLILSAAPFGLFLGAAIGGRIADYLGHRRTLIVSMFLFGVCSLLTAFSESAQALVVARLITGMGLGGALPNFIALASHAAPEDRRISAVTAVMAGMPFGGAVAATMALGEGLQWDWRTIFYVGGIGPLLVALLLWKSLPAHSAEREVRAGDTRVAGIGEALLGRSQLVTTLLLWAAYFFTQLVLLLMLNWLPTLMVGLGFSRLQASWASIWFNLCGSLGAIALGRLHGGARRRLWVAVTYGAIVLSVAVVPLFVRTFTLAAIACGLAGIFIVGAQLILFAQAPLYYLQAVRGTGIGFCVAVGRLGAVVGPLYASALLIAGASSGTVLVGIVPFAMAAGAAAFALTWRPQRST